jgi:hypothetical protein
MAIGRISGQLLKANLIRDGVDLAFETDLLYLDVNNSRVGINNASPQYALDIIGTARTSDLEVGNELTVGDITITGNTLSTSTGTLGFSAAAGEATVYHARLQVDSIEIRDNVISTTDTNANLEFNPNGTGTVDIQSSTNITGDLDVTGNIRATGNIQIDGDLIIGDSITDTITINASINSDLIPETDNTYDLGNASFGWRNVYANGVFATSLNLNSFEVGNLVFFDNTITTATNQDLIIDPNGTGVVRIGNLEISTNRITNTVSGAVTELAQTGTGYFKIAGTNGFIPPSGTTAQRPSALLGYPVIPVGLTRYNTDSKALEIWDGLQWASPAGVSGAVSETGANDIAAKFALTLG